MCDAIAFKMLQLKWCLICVLFRTLVSPASFVVKSKEITNTSHTLVLAIDRILDDSISKQSNSLFICHRTTLQSYDELKPTELLDELLQFMSNEMRITVVITADEYERPISHNNLLIVDGYESFRKIYGIMTKTQYKFDSNGYFLIVLASSEENQTATVHNILTNCWELHISNVVILAPTANYNRILLYTFFPYSEEHCEQVKPILRNYFENDSFQLNVSHFPKKCENFHQCPLHVAATDDPPYTFLPDEKSNETSDFSGLDAMVVGEISRRLNFEMIVLPYSGGFQYDHKQLCDTRKLAFGWISKLYTGRKDSCRSLMLKDALVRMPLSQKCFPASNTYSKVNISVAGENPFGNYRKQSTIPYIYDSRVFVIPPGKPYSSLAKLFFPFKMEVWLCVGSSFLAMAIWILALNFISEEKCYFVIGRKNDAPILNLLSIILGGSMTAHQLPRRNFARTILGLLLLSTLILRNAYLGNLFNFLQTQRRMQPLHTQQDIYDSDVTMYVLRTTGGIFHSPDLQNRVRGTKLTMDDMRDDNLDGVYLQLKNIVDYNNFLNFRKPKILTAKGYINMYPIWMWVRRFSCLKLAFDHQISALHSSGLVQHWQTYYTKTVDDIEDKEPEELKIDQFTGIIMISATLYALSIFVFVMELLVSKYVKKKTFM